MANANLISRVSSNFEVQAEERRADRSVFKQNFNINDFLSYFESNGFIRELEAKTTSEDKLFHVINVFEQFYPRPSRENLDFCAFVVNSFLKRHSAFDLGMCPYLSIDLGEEGYIKNCSVSNTKYPSTSCLGFRKEFCVDYLKSLEHP